MNSPIKPTDSPRTFRLWQTEPATDGSYYKPRVVTNNPSTPTVTAWQWANGKLHAPHNGQKQKRGLTDWALTMMLMMEHRAAPHQRLGDVTDEEYEKERRVMRNARKRERRARRG